jgi:hypothetical protein
MWHDGSRYTTGQRCARRTNRRRNIRPLLLERLEDRTLLSTYTVNGLGDAGSGSGLAGDLRYCVNRANANPGSTIQFGVTGAINLGSGLTISSNLTITGPGASSVAVKGGGSSSNFSVFTVNSGVTASISGLTISNGNAPNGGGVYNAGSLTLTNDTLSGNSAKYNGGGVYNGNGTATLTDDTLSGNSAQCGGGVYNSGTAMLTNDTLSGNSAQYGGVYNFSGTATLNNTVVANSPSGGDIYIYGSVKGSNNLIDDASTAGGLTNGVNGNIVGVNPLLAPLGNYGGPTQTMRPLPGSPVIGAGSTVLIPAGITTDQRGEPRIVNGKVDIGAVQSQGSTFNPAPAPQPYKLVKEVELVPVTKLVKVTELVPVVKQVKVTELVKVKNKLVKQNKLVDETKLVKETKPIKETKLVKKIELVKVYY